MCGSERDAMYGSGILNFLISRMTSYLVFYREVKRCASEPRGLPVVFWTNISCYIKGRGRLTKLSTIYRSSSRKQRKASFHSATQIFGNNNREIMKCKLTFFIQLLLCMHFVSSQKLNRHLVICSPNNGCISQYKDPFICPGFSDNADYFIFLYISPSPNNDYWLRAFGLYDSYLVFDAVQNFAVEKRLLNFESRLGFLPNHINNSRLERIFQPLNQRYCYAPLKYASLLDYHDDKGRLIRDIGTSSWGLGCRLLQF